MMRNLIKLAIPCTGKTKSWHDELHTRERATQIQSQIPKAAGVMLAGHGDSCSNTGVVTNVSIEFAYDDFDVASAQFFMVGEKLKLPTGSKLTHVIFDPEDGSCDFAALAEW